MEDKKLRSRIYDWLNERVDLRGILSWFTLTGLVYGQLDKRLNIRGALEKALRQPVPKHVNWLFCLGGITFVLFIIQVITGVLLAFYYKPTAGEAYVSVQYIMNEVRFGWLIRQVHAWSGNLMILTILLHMFRVFFYGAYKSPRELNWMVGVLLFFVTLAFGFTGHLLPWDQRAYWAITVGIGLISRIPLAGGYLGVIIRGGEDVNGATLIRFFALHVMILPWIMAFLMLLHFIMIKRQGISEPL